MKESIILELLQNTAILLTLSMLYNYFWAGNEKSKSIFTKISTGFILGIIGIVLILTPWNFTPGIFFDTRSVMLSVSGLFFGPIPTIIAMIANGAFRFYIGGEGTLMGIAVIFTSGSLGLLWRFFRPDWKNKNHYIELITLGILVHLVMLSCTFLLPTEIGIITLKSIALQVMIIYPIATVLLGILILSQDKNWENRKALRVSEERWRYALEGSGDGLWDWNPQTNEVLFSEKWKNMIGYEDHEIENELEEWDKRVFPDDKELVYEKLNLHIEGKTPAYLSEHRMLCKDGTYKWILDRGKIMTRDEEGKPLRFIGTHTDISDRKLAQLEFKRLNEHLEQKVIERTKELQNNEAALLNLVEDLNIKTDELHQSTNLLVMANKELEAFSYSVSHDLRAPLRAINGFISILTEDYEKVLDEEGIRICNVIHSNGIKMGQLIDDLLSFSRLIRSDLHHSRIDMDALVRSLVSDIGTATDSPQPTITINKLPQTIGDSNLIKQVWINLISNAIKYSSKEENAKIIIGSSQGENEDVFFIKDNGVGFNMNYAHKLFGVFQRLHRPTDFEGTGVGLAIVQRIVNRHGGRVWAEGEVENGACFYFSLPSNNTNYQ